MSKWKNHAQQAASRKRHPGFLAASLIACLSLLALQGRASGQPRAVWNDTMTVRKVAFSPDGKTLASVSSGAETIVRLWDAASGKEVATLPTQWPGGCSLLTFTSGGKGLVVSASRRQHDGETEGFSAERAVLWDVATRKVQSTIDLPPGVAVEALTPDDKTLVAVTWEKGAVLYDLASGKEKETIPFVKEDKVRFTGLALSPDGKTLAVGQTSGAVILWDVEKKKARWTIQAAQGNASVLKFSPDSKTLAALVEDGKMDLWDVAAGKRQDTLDVGNSTRVLDVAYAPDGKSMALVGGGRCPCLWDFAAAGERDDFGGAKYGARRLSVAFSPDGKTLAIAVNKTIELWDVPQTRPTGVKPRE